MLYKKGNKMREYIQPTVEIIPTIPYVLAGSDINNEVGGNQEFGNTTTFEKDILMPEKSLWDEEEK